MSRNPKVLGSSAFKAWFAGSMVVDTCGQPLVVYHGTFCESILTFETDILGAFFSTDASVAEHYGRENTIYPVYLAIHNPLIADARNSPWDEIEFTPDMRVMAKIAGFKFEGYEDGTIDADTLAKLARAAGHDGLIVRNVYESAADVVADEIVAFNPLQIKSSIGNLGTYDPQNPDIRFSFSQRYRNLERAR
jgi:hypothetical protein